MPHRDRGEERTREPTLPRLAVPRFVVLLVLAAALVVYGVIESLFWSDHFWGAHFYAFYPRATMMLAAGGALLLIGWAFVGKPHSLPTFTTPISRRTRGIAAAVAALVAGGVFWAWRERHLFWGDALPLSIDIPRGQAFHPDEPLTMFLHHVFYVLGGGRWSGATAVAIGSTLAGMLFVATAVWWFSRRSTDHRTWILAAATLITQGFVALFFGHVENYSYLALALLVFFISGVDFLEGRGSPYVPIGAAVLAYALHILGGLLVIPAAVIVWFGLADPGRRKHTAIAVVAAVALLLVASAAASGLYSNRSPLDGLMSGASRVFGNARDMRPEVMGASRHWANVWSQFNLIGPLSLLWLAIVFAVLGAKARSPKGLFFALGAFALLGPCLITGEGNLGAARNWDLFAAPALVAPLAGLTLLLEHLDVGQARRLMMALLAVSLFHTVPWIALNTDTKGTVGRIARLPLTGGRGEIMIGTHYLNRGELPLAEHWFQLAVARDFDNANGQSGLGLALARQGKLNQAVGPMIAATKLRPGVLTYQDDLIALFLALKRWDQASAVLRDRIDVEPSNVDAWRMLANCRTRMNDHDGAVTVLEEGCQRVGYHPALMSSLADAYEWAVAQHGRRSEWPQARAQLDRFAAAFPDDPRIPRLRSGIP